MDLRKLRNHPISEVARFKKTMKSATPYAAIFAIVIAIAALAFALYRFHDSKQIQKEPIKVFKAIEPPNPLGEKEQKKQISSIPSENRDADLSHETLMGRMPVSSEDRSEIDSEFETPAPTTQSTLDAPTVSNIEAAKQKKEGEARKAEIAKLNAEADQVLADGEAILSQARATMHRAAPYLLAI